MRATFSYKHLRPKGSLTGTVLLIAGFIIFSFCPLRTAISNALLPHQEQSYKQNLRRISAMSCPSTGKITLASESKVSRTQKKGLLFTSNQQFGAGYLPVTVCQTYFSLAFSLETPSKVPIYLRNRTLLI